MKYGVDKKRLKRALGYAPLVGLLAPSLFIILKLAQGNIKSLDSLGGISLMFIFSFFVGAPLAYFMMFTVGLPTIKLIEKFRPNKADACLIYLGVSLIYSVVMGFFVFPGILPVLILSGFMAGVATAYIMLRKREDWKVPNAPSEDSLK